MLGNPVKMRMLIEQLESNHRLKKDKKSKSDKEKKSKKDKKIKHTSKSSHSGLTRDSSTLRKNDRSSLSNSRSRSRENDRKKDRKSKDGSSKSTKKDSRRHRSHSRSLSSSERESSKKKRRESEKSSKKHKKEEKYIQSVPEDQFTEFIKGRLGPLVEYNPEDNSMRFTAKRRFNDSKIYDEKMKKKLREQMQKDAEDYRRKKIEVGEILGKVDQENQKTLDSSGKLAGGFMNKFGQEAFERAGKEGLEAGIKRGKYFMDNTMDRDE